MEEFGAIHDEELVKLRYQLTELNTTIDDETKSMKGLEKLVKFHENDPAAKHRAKVDLVEQRQKIRRLKKQRYQLEVNLYQVCKAHNVNLEVTHPPPSPLVDDFEALSDSSDDEMSFKALVLYDYNAKNEGELSIKAGDVVIVSEKDDSGWWYATLNGKEGFIPSNYTKKIPSK